MRPITSLVVSLLLAVAVAGCNNSTTTVSPTVTTSASPATITFTSQLAVRGSATRSFTMSTAGTVKVTLATLGNGSLSAGLGVGVPVTGTPCSLAQSLVTGPGDSPQVVTTADAGTYCVQLYDAGSLTEDTAFSITIEHP
jgi:hypothetical protein